MRYRGGAFPNPAPGADGAVSSAWAFVLIACAFSLCGCSREPRADLVLFNGPEAESLDPHILTGQPDGRISAGLFEGFTRFDPRTGKAIPGLASHWEISDGGRRYTFHVRREARWSTGEPITAPDFVWSWNRAIDPATAADYSGFFFYVKNGFEIATWTNSTAKPPPLGIRALDERTAEVDLVNPTPFFLELCAMRIMAAAPRATIERYGDQWLRAIPLPCSGPYGLLDWRPNDRVRLRKNPFYWDAANVSLDRIDILSGDSASTALNLYLTGEVDYLVDRYSIPDQLADQLTQRPDFHRFDYLGVYFIRFNCTRAPFSDPRVRRAFCLVTDRRRIVERLTKLGERPAAALTPPGAGGYQPPPGLGQDALDVLAQPGDPTARDAAYRSALDKAAVEARALLAEAGFPEGRGFPAFEYMYNAGGGGGSRLHEQIAIEWQAMLRDRLGVRMELRPVEWKTYLSDMSKLNYTVVRGSWIGDYDDPTTFLDCFLSDSGNNRTGWRSADYDHLMSRAAATPGGADRWRLLRSAESLLVHDQAPVLPIYYYSGMMAFDPARWTGIWPTPTDEHPYWSIRRVREIAATVR